MIEDKRSYDIAWQDLTRREAILRVISAIFYVVFSLSCVGIIAVGSLIFFITDSLGSESLLLQVALAIFIVGGIIAASWFYRNTFPCPRCRRSFFIYLWSLPPQMGDGQKCPHCGLKRYSS